MVALRGRNERYAVGAIAGFVAFVVGYLFVYLLSGRDVEGSLEPIDAALELFQAEPVGTWRVVGWLLYSAHFVDTRLVAGIGPIETAVYVDLVGEGSSELLYLVPPTILLVAGFLVVFLARLDDPIQGATLGVSVTIGYLLAVGIGLVAFAYGDTRPDPAVAIVVAGVVYPAVFGAIGGAIASVLRDSRS